MTESVDCIVVGAGVVGLAVARRLAFAGRDVIVLETEDTIGTLEPGKFADFTVLDQDYFTIPMDEVLNLKAIMTGLSGEIVWINTSGGDEFPDWLK